MKETKSTVFPRDDRIPHAARIVPDGHRARSWRRIIVPKPVQRSRSNWPGSALSRAEHP